jgi:hypothetical protein
MDSIYANLFVQLQTQLQTEVPELRWIDFDHGQLEIEGDRPAVSFPCVLIDFNGSQFSQLLQNIETADNCVIQIRIAFAPYSNTNQLTPVDSKAKALNYFEIENKVYRALKGWYATLFDADENEYAICQPLNRIADATEKREDTLRVRNLLFATSYEDDTANTTLRSVAVGLTIEEGSINDGIGFMEIEKDFVVHDVNIETEINN